MATEMATEMATDMATDMAIDVLVGLRRFAPRERVTTTGASAAVTFFLVSVISTAIAPPAGSRQSRSTGPMSVGYSRRTRR